METIKQIYNSYKWVILIALSFLIFMLINRACEQEPKIVTKTVTKVVKVSDTITKTVIKEVPKIVYVNRYVNAKGEKQIVYVDKPTDTKTIKANQYDTELKANNATAKLKITTSGELLDIQGVIDYPKETTTTTITKYKNKSGLFLFSQVPINRNQINVEVGLLYQFKNTLGIIGSVQYNEFTKSADVKAGVAIKIF